MNPQIAKLHKIAGKQSRWIIGLMSGTSLDGLDIALCKITGVGASTQPELLHFETIPYSPKEREKIKTIFAKKTVDLQQMTLLNARLGNLHGEMILDFLKRKEIDPDSIDAIASHGQTVFHAPKSLHQQNDFPNATLQIGDGDHIAVRTGIITLSDFRQKHVAAGGEGAPLAVYGDILLASLTSKNSPKKENKIFLNIGGIANFTFLPADSLKSILVTDTGPGNTLIDLIIQKYLNQPFDNNGEHASGGKIIPELLAVLKEHSFFKLPLPKTTGQELFNSSFLEKAAGQSGIVLPKKGPRTITDLQKLKDLAATLSQLTIDSITEKMQSLKLKEAVVYVSGGGVNNPYLMKGLKKELRNFKIRKTDDFGISADAKEAVLFALLGNQTLAGHPIKIGHLPQVNFGKISFPK